MPVAAPPADDGGMTPATDAAPAMSGGGSSGSGSGSSAGDVRTPCMMGEVTSCVCEASGTQGDQSCEFDDSSSEDGFFGECRHCAPAPLDAGDACSDGKKNGKETGTDCGGADCDPCVVGGGCVTDADCAAAICFEGTCTASGAAGAGGSGGSGGSSGSGGTGGGGSGGSGGSGGPVADCTGQPDDVPCMRNCILNLVPLCHREDCDCRLP
jgi:hypothetical protein